MKLVRSVFRSADFVLSRQVRRRGVIGTLNANPYPVYIEKSSLVHGSDFKWHGRSFTVSVPSNTPEVKKAGKRVSKNERKAMVKAFVCKYRSMNAGKFPTASDARKEVGGSYYTIRQILQELEYNLQTSPIDTREATSKVNAVKKNTSKEGMETSFSALEYLNDEMGSISTLNSKSQGVADHAHLPGEAKGKLHSHCEKPVYETKDDTGSEDMLKFGGLRAKTEQQPSPDLGNSGRELYKEPTGDAESQGKSSVWKNLRSLINNIIGEWGKP